MTRRRRRPAGSALSWSALPSLALLLTACGGSAADEGSAGEGQGATLTVYAAASLTATFTELAEELERTHEGLEVELSFGGSSDLATQLQEGAEADVLASADTSTMDLLVADGLVEEPRDFATNTLRLAVPPGNPAGVEGLADLAAEDVRLVVCAPQVPCGAAAVQVAEAAGVPLAPVSEEQSVTDVLAKVAAGEADAGLVYVTDVQAAGEDVEGIDLPEAASAVNTYPLAVLSGSDDPELAQELVDLVLGPTGRTVLGDAGFGLP